jgi:HlyD family secretion protein
MVAGVLVAALVVGSVIFRAVRSETTQASVPHDEQAVARNMVAALGRIEPASEIVNLGAGSSPDRLDTLLVERGDLVRKSQVLGYLGGYAEQIAERDVFRSQLEEARLRLSTQLDLDHARVEAAEVHQRQVLEVGPQGIAAQEATIASLEAKLANDKSVLDAEEQLMARGTGTRRQTEDQNSLVLQDQANLNAARAHLSELRLQFEINKIEAGVQIRMARATLEHMQAEFPLASIERQIALAEARARRLTLIAPIDGRILNIMVKPGEVITTGPVLAMGDTDRMRAVAEIYETDIARVQTGQPATVSSRALAAPIHGKVARIGNMIFKNDILNIDPAARADARVVEVWIDLDDSAATAQLTNLTVDVRIDTAAAGPAIAGPAGQTPPIAGATAGPPPTRSQ